MSDQPSWTESEDVPRPIVNGVIRHSSYTEEQGDLLREYLSELGPGRVRGSWAPAADGIVEVGVILQWVAVPFVMGFLREAGSDFYKLLKPQLSRYVAIARNRFKERATFSELRVEYSDLDVIIRTLGDEELPDVNGLLELLAQRLTSGRLREVPGGVFEVFMPTTYDTEYESWNCDYYPTSLEQYGVWAITGVTSDVFQHPYDAINDCWLNPLYPWME